MKNTTVVCCFDCGRPEWWSSAEIGSVVSECICENKRIKCDCCGHEFLQKDLSQNSIFIALCKICNEHESHLMDNMAVARFKKASRLAAMLCVEPIGEKLQLTMRAYHLGVSIVFPAMTKEELVFRWIFGAESPHKEVPEADFLFDAAFLRLMEDYMSRSEVSTHRLKAIRQSAGQVVSVIC